MGGGVCNGGKKATSSVWPPRVSVSPGLPSLSPLSGQELNNFQLSGGPSNGKAGPLTPQTPKG